MTPDFEQTGVLIVQQILGIGRTMQMYDPSNHAVTSALHNFAMNVNGLMPMGQGKTTIQFIDKILMVNDQRVNPTPNAAQSFAMLKQVFFERGLGGMAFTSPQNPETLRQFFSLFVRPVPNPAAKQALRAQLDQYVSYGIELLETKTLGEDDDTKPVNVSSMSFALQTYARAMVVFQEYIRLLRDGRNPLDSPLNFVHVIQDLVEVVSDKPSNLVRALWLFSINKDAISSEFAKSVHAANTSVYAALMGRVLGLGRLGLLDLGTSALLANAAENLHPDVLPSDMGRRMSADYKALLIRAVPTMTENAPLNNDVLKRIIVGNELQKPYKDPESQVRNDLHVFSRIAAVADAFDLRMSPAGGSLSPAQSLSVVQQASDGWFDPVAVAALETVVEAYMSS